MRHQTAVAAAFTLAAAIVGTPAHPRAEIIQTVTWTVASAAPSPTFARAPADPASPHLSVPLSNDDASSSGVFLDSDISGGVTLLPITTIATAPATGTDDDGDGWQARQTAEADDADPCAAAICTIAVDQLPFALGTAAFALGSFISDAVAAVDYVFVAGGSSQRDDGGYGPWGMVGIGNFALLAVGLIGLALTRRRDHLPPG